MLLLGLVAGIVLRPIVGLILGFAGRIRLNLVRIRDDALVANSSVVGSIAIDVCLGDLVVNVITLAVVVIGVLADAGVRDGIRVVAIVHNSGQHIRSNAISG